MTFVLVHGGGLDRACWEALIPLLDRPTLAVDLPGRGRTPARMSDVTIDDFVDAVVSEIRANDLTDALLVGHSLAGITLPGVAAAIPDRIRAMVFIACAVPPHGDTIGSVLGSLSPATSDLVLRLGNDAITGEGTLHPDLAAAMFCNDMDDELAAHTLSIMTSEAPQIMDAPVDLTGLDQPLPRTYVRLLQDASLVLDTQDRMIANLRGADVIDLDAGHMAMLSRPAELAAILNAL